jgi:hypothetical protein
VTVDQNGTAGRLTGLGCHQDSQFITTAGVIDHPVDDLPGLIVRPDGLLWLDIPDWVAMLRKPRTRSGCTSE